MDDALRTLAAPPRASRSTPKPQATTEIASELSPADQSHVAGLMRVNHVGEVCAQALYSSQALFSKNPALSAELRTAALEERDHLAWTAQRLTELSARPSLLNPAWYAGAFALGAVAARLGDGVSLGFVVETERQVTRHLESHLAALPASDDASRAIVLQMRDDEAAHAEQAQTLGATALPDSVSRAMQAMAKVMTTTAYRI